MLPFLPSLTQADFRTHIARSMRVFRLDVDALKETPALAIAAWQSFWAAAIIFPLYLTRQWAVVTDPDLKISSFHAVLDIILVYPVLWMIYPVALYVAIGQQNPPAYYRFVTASNWLRVITEVASFVLLTILTVVPGLGMFVMLAWGIYLIRLSWFLLRQTFEVPGGTVFGLLMLEWVLVLIIQMTLMFSLGLPLLGAAIETGTPTSS